MNPTSPRNARRRRVLLVVLASCTTVGALAWATHGWLWKGASVSTDNAYTRGEVTPIAPRASGYVSEVLVDDNAAVKSGDVLFRIEDADYRAHLEEARANVSRQVSALASLEKQIQLQETMIGQAGAEVRAAEVEANRASLDARRFADLVAQNAASRQAQEAADATHLKALAASDAARANRTAQSDKLQVLRAQRQEIAAAMRQAEAARELATIALGHTVVRAPVDGVVANRQVRVGRYVAPGAAALSLVPLRDIWVIANYKETQLTDVKVGDRAEVTFDMYPGVELSGTVDGIAPGSGAQFALLPADNATGNFTKIVQRVPVKIVLAPSHALSGKLFAGLSAEVTIHADSGGATTATN
ncbi:HlyD family secretion protein [Lysobacter sp. A6]|uniref:HlyD family secretion protein n=1 Tax=Noviluteimonas lactosilytica TaxID=2888523 RepID=A0ABS8JJS3_9GAMM|nr:HlyD family secretion protein [Lysobacter lactosilyticus]MCC8363750.1 HlyD family secretion protein [Lysobacter lactosilyticus]